jgi:hypothetical protein
MVVRDAGVKSMDGLAKSERSEVFGADRVLEHVGSPTGASAMREMAMDGCFSTHLTVGVANLVG